MVGFLESILRNMKRLNCFPRPTQHSEHSEQSVPVLDCRKDILITKASGSSTQRQASGTDTFNDSLEAIEIPVSPPRSAASVDDLRTLRRVERNDDARSETQTIKPSENEYNLGHSEGSVGDQQERAVVQPRKIVPVPEAVGRSQQELGEEVGQKENEHVAVNDIYRENVQKDIHLNETAAECDKKSTFGTEKSLLGGEQDSKPGFTRPTARFSQASSLSLSAPSLPSAQEVLSSDVIAESVALSSLSPWDAYGRYYSVLGPASLSADSHVMLTPSGSPSSCQQSRPLGLEPSQQQAHAVVSVISSRAESPALPVRLRAHRSIESLRTPSEESVDHDWHGTILDMEGKSAKGGEPVYFQAKLDTFARRDAIAENIVNRLGMKWKPDPNCRTFEVMGSGADAGNVIRPLGYVTLSLRVIGQKGRLKYKFYVLADSEVGGAFDCVLGCTTTMKHFLALRRDSTHQESLSEHPRDE